VPVWAVLACDDESCEPDRDEVFHDRSRVAANAGDRCETRSVTCVRADHCPGDAGNPPNISEPSCIVATIHPTNAPPRLIFTQNAAKDEGASRPLAFAD
jgi:hypothetical protein